MISSLLEGKKAIPCDYIGCTSTFTSNANLARHLTEHRGEKPYVCQFCNKSFGRSFTLRRHLVIHTGEMPYKCEHAGCKKSFNTTGNLSRHKRIHLKSKKAKKDEKKPRKKCVELLNSKMNKRKIKHQTELLSLEGHPKKRKTAVDFLDKKFNVKNKFQVSLEPIALNDERNLMNFDSFDLGLVKNFILDDNLFSDADEPFLPTSSERTAVNDNSVHDSFEDSDPFFAKNKCYEIITEIEAAVKMVRNKAVIESLIMKMSDCVRFQLEETLNIPGRVHESCLNDSRVALMCLMRSLGSLLEHLNSINFDVLNLNAAQFRSVLANIYEVKGDAAKFSKVPKP